jgi:hypothetical protein
MRLRLAKEARKRYKVCQSAGQQAPHLPTRFP